MRHFRTFEYCGWDGNVIASKLAKNCEAALLQVGRDCNASGEVFEPDNFNLNAVYVEKKTLTEFADRFKEHLLSENVRVDFVDQPEEDDTWLIVSALLSFLENHWR